MRELTILIILLINLTSTIGSRHKIMMDWHEPAELKIQAAFMEMIDAEKAKTEKPKVFTAGFNATFSDVHLAEVGQFPFYALLMFKGKSEW